MSTAPLVRDADLGRLLEDGYDVRIEGGHLVVQHVPYVTTGGTVGYGALAYPVTVSGDQIVSSTDHRLWFAGTVPCDEQGKPLVIATAEQRFVTDELQASFMLSSKPAAGYTDQYDKVTAYVRIVSHPAQALDESMTATPGGAWQEVEDGLPFVYRDTASTRAGLADLNRAYRGLRIVIVGLGGSGSYVLDQVAKTPVAEIVLIDGDLFDNHNAFRAPGAASLEQLRARPTKAAYYAELYGHMHTAITAVPDYLSEENLSLLDGADFVFVAMDDAEAKQPIVAHLTTLGVPLIDVGMGVEEIDGRLSGLLRTLFVPAGTTLEQAMRHIPKPAVERDDYNRNIQVADLNALNGVLAVLRWKRHLGYYADGTEETLSTYSIYTNEVSNTTDDDETYASGEDKAGVGEVDVEDEAGREIEVVGSSTSGSSDKAAPGVNPTQAAEEAA